MTTYSEQIEALQEELGAVDSSFQQLVKTGAPNGQSVTVELGKLIEKGREIFAGIISLQAAQQREQAARKVIGDTGGKLKKLREQQAAAEIVAYKAFGLACRAAAAASSLLTSCGEAEEELSRQVERARGVVGEELYHRFAGESSEAIDASLAALEPSKALAREMFGHERIPGNVWLLLVEAGSKE